MALWSSPILADSRGGRGNIDESDYGDVATAGKINAGYLACATDIVILQWRQSSCFTVRCFICIFPFIGGTFMLSRAKYLHIMQNGLTPGWGVKALKWSLC
ncbi:MAG: hypothetical protein U1F63_12995 [Chitinivorax sp.]